MSLAHSKKVRYLFWHVQKTNRQYIKESELAQYKINGKDKKYPIEVKARTWDYIAEGSVLARCQDDLGSNSQVDIRTFTTRGHWSLSEAAGPEVMW